MSGSAGSSERSAPVRSRIEEEALTRGRRPSWLRVRAPMGVEYQRLRSLMRGQQLHTVCEEAACPNIGECWASGTATFLLLGEICTRNCRFCNVQTGKPLPPDADEPRRVAEAVDVMRLQHAVLTSVTRDDLPDGGASIFAQTIIEIRTRSPECTVEVLIPDFGGNWRALQSVMDQRPQILNHNLETVQRLYPAVRPQADYRRSLALLDRAKRLEPAGLTKSGLMVGLGETREELQQAMADLRAVGCDILTLGQYLQPSRHHLPIERYYSPEEFEELGDAAWALGFTGVESAPLVRSSYHAERHAGGIRAESTPAG
jgi:lipoic acid synthetase